jgi:hypothetical protein
MLPPSWLGQRMQFNRLKRREFIALIAGTAVWPLVALPGVAFAQSSERVRIGYLWVGAEGSDGLTLNGVRQGLADVGLVEGRNLVLERRYADSHPQRLNALAMELVRLEVAVLLAPGAVATRAARSATETIPIVSVTNDPVALGFAQTLARPGGNVTGLAITASDQLVGKWVELLKDVRPALKKAALLYDPRPAPMIERVAHDASATIGVEIIPFRVTDAEELGAALAAVEMAQPDGLLSKYPPAEPGALGLEPLEAAYPCRFNSAAPPAPRNASTSYVETIRLTSLLGRQACITAPQSGASAFKPSIDAIPFVCLAARRGATMERGASTAGYVKLLLPPRQSRGNSHVGLAHPARLVASCHGRVSVTADQAHAIPDAMSPACSWLRVRPDRDREGNFRPRGIASPETAAKVGARQE